MRLMDPINDFYLFYSNPTIGRLGTYPRWTVVDSELIPIHMPELLDHGNIREVSEISEACTVSLTDMTRCLPNAANCSFYLTLNDGVAAALVDRAAPAELIAQLRQLPTLYAEHSMNGSGLLFLIPTPQVDTGAAPLHGTAILEPYKDQLQLVLQGWVTFSRNVLTQGNTNVADNDSQFSVFWDKQLMTVELMASHYETSAAAAEMPLVTGLLDLMTRKPLRSQLSGARGDIAAYEHAVLGELCGRLIPLVRTLKNGLRLGLVGEAYLLYNAAIRMLPHRHSFGGGIEPALFDAARNTITQHDLMRPPAKRLSR